MSVALLSCYYNFNDNPWMQENTRYCAQQWRKSGAHIIFVEIAIHDTPFVFHPSVDEGYDDTRNIFHKLIQFRVSDVMWYKEMATNLALAHIPSSCSYVAWIDNDVCFAPPSHTTETLSATWWTDAIQHAFRQRPATILLQPFTQVALTTETVRIGLLGNERKENPTHASPTSDDCNTNEPETTTESSSQVSRLTFDEAIGKCHRMTRIKPSVMINPVKGVSGGVWVARRELLQSCGLFQYAYAGGGDALLLNLLQGATNAHTLRVVDDALQRYYFHEQGPYTRYLQRYRRKLMMHCSIPAQFACFECTLMHLHHGELEKRTTPVDRLHLLQSRQFNASRHICANPKMSGIVQWNNAFRDTNINAEFLQSLERSQTVRDKVLLRMARTQRCLQTMQSQMTALKHTETTKQTENDKSRRQMQTLLQQCLLTFDTL